MIQPRSGSCHCGRIRFRCEVDLAPAGARSPQLRPGPWYASTLRCNCSYCRKTRIWKAHVPAEAFTEAEPEPPTPDVAPEAPVEEPVATVEPEPEPTPAPEPAPAEPLFEMPAPVEAEPSPLALPLPSPRALTAACVVLVDSDEPLLSAEAEPSLSTELALSAPPEALAFTLHAEPHTAKAKPPRTENMRSFVMARRLTLAPARTKRWAVRKW